MISPISPTTYISPVASAPAAPKATSAATLTHTQEPDQVHLSAQALAASKDADRDGDSR